MATLDQLRSGHLLGETHVRLQDNLREIPPELFTLSDSLEFLDLSHNRLTHLPENFGEFKKLKTVFFNYNDFQEFPQVLSRCPQLSMVGFKGNQIHTVAPDALSPNLRWLILTDNQLEQLPATIGRLDRLQKLMLAGNRLRSLPPELAQCRSLELIRLAANQLPALPDWLTTLPRLSWLAYSGNPGVAAHLPAQQPLPMVKRSQLTLGEQLGEGASGVIYRGQWHSPSQQGEAPKQVAVKIFKGAVTSDGLPLDEMRAAIAAGAHPNLVTPLGQLQEGGELGLVFSFITSDYGNLGQPPSLETCTRDTYPDQRRFTPEEIVTTALGIAAALEQLHQRGIMHGDLYAHNILVNGAGHCFLGDFGAASFYPDPSMGPALERLEVRAFGCLLEDLCDRTTMEQGRYYSELRQLQQDCMQPQPAARPSFQYIHRRLQALVQ